MSSNSSTNFWTKSLDTRNSRRRNSHSNKCSDEKQSTDQPKCANISHARVVQATDTDSEDSGTVCGWNDSLRSKRQENGKLFNVESSDNHLERRFSHLFRTDLPEPLHVHSRKLTSFAEERKRRKSSTKNHPNCSKLPPKCDSNVRKFRNGTSKRHSLDDLTKVSKSSQTECDNWLARTAPAEMESYYPKFYDQSIEGAHCCRYFSKSMPYLDNFGSSIQIPTSNCDFYSSRSSMSWTDSSFKTSDYEGSFEDSTESLSTVDYDYGKKQSAKSQFSPECHAWVSHDRDLYDRQIRSVTTDFGRSKSDTALDRLFSEIPENSLKYMTTFNSMQNSRKSCQNTTICQINNPNMLCKNKSAAKNHRTSECSNKLSRNRKCEHRNCCFKKIRKQSSQSLECIPNKSSLKSKEEIGPEFYDRKYNTLRCSTKNRSKLEKSPNILAAKGKVKDLIERFSSLETLQNKTDSPLIKILRTKLDFSKTDETTSHATCLPSNKFFKNEGVVKEPRFGRRVVLSGHEKESSGDCSEPTCEEHSSSDEFDSPFTRMIKRAPTTKQSRYAEDIPIVDECKPLETFYSPKNKSPISITACNSCGSKNVKQYQFYDDPFQPLDHGKVEFVEFHPKFDLSDNIQSDANSSDLISETKTNSKPYIQLKSLRSWRDASKNKQEVQLKKLSLVDNFQNKIRSSSKSHEITAQDFPITFDDFENFSKIEDASVLLRRLSCQSNSSESLKFDPICSSLLSDLDDIPMKDSQGFNNYFAEFQENKNGPIIESEDRKSCIESLPFYSKLFRSSKNYFRRRPSMRSKPEETKGAILTDFQQRRHSLSGASTNLLLTKVSEVSSKDLIPLSMHPMSMPPTSPPLEGVKSTSLVRPSPPYFSTWNHFGKRRTEFGSKSLRL